MFCETLMRDACPCILAEIDHCRCCSLLMGKDFCQCDYPGVCIYEKRRWKEKQPLPDYDQVVAVFPFTTSTGAVIRWEKCAATNPGDTVIMYSQGQNPVSGVVLQTYLEQKLAYVLITDTVPVLPLGVPLTIHQGRNVFGSDAALLLNTSGKSIEIVADADLLPALTILADGMKKQGASVTATGLNENQPKGKGDLLIIISRNNEAMSHSLKRLPLLNKSSSAFWFVQ